MRCGKGQMLLYAVTDRAWTGRQSLCEQVQLALAGGVTCVQLREKDLEEAAFLAEALEVKKLCRAAGVPFIINDNVEVAIECGADGVHVGQQDMAAGAVRAAVGDKMIVGVSAQTVEQARQAVRNGADYIGAGAMFATATKQDASVIARETLTAICRAVPVPVVAIGGISRSNIMELAGSGVDGVALVSAIFGSSDITGACRSLRELAAQMIAVSKEKGR